METVDIVHSGAEATRAEKIARLSRSSVALAHLRVCWQNVGKAYNCCRCEKCLRTMADLELCGVLDGMEAFPLPLTPDVMRSVRIQPHLLGFWQEWLERARQANIDQALCDTVAELVSRERFEQLVRRSGHADVRPSAAFRHRFHTLTAQGDRRGALTGTRPAYFPKNAAVAAVVGVCSWRIGCCVSNRTLFSERP